jgi:uncharacterized protein YlxW (UPF0749 family)
MKDWKVALTFGVVCFVLTIGICIQLKTIDNTNSTVTQTLTGNELRDQVLKWKEKYDKAVVDLGKSEQKLEDVRQQSTKNDETAINKEEQIKLDNTIIGLTDVTGNGIVITLRDNNTIKKSNISPLEDINLYLVHAGDLVEVVNALKNAGAEAISINGERITNFTSIYCAGNVVVVNGEKISSPIEIKAIGSPELLYGALTIPGGYLDLMEETGVMVEVKKTENIKIKKYEGIINSQYMKSE